MMNQNRTCALLAAVALTAAAPLHAQRSDDPVASGEVIQTAFHDFRVVEIADGLINPHSIAFLPNGDVLVTERPGRLRIVRDGALLPEPVAGVPAVLAQGQGGLLDVALAPDFAERLLRCLGRTGREAHL